MSRVARVPREFGFVPFCGSDAVRRGQLSKDMLRGRTWRRLFRDVYVHAGAFAADDHRMWCHGVALLLRGNGAIDGLSAAALWGVDLLPRAVPVSLSVPRSVRLLPHPRLSITRATLPLDDVTTLAGIPLTTPVRTAFDLARRLTRAEALVAVDALCHRRLVTVPQLTTYAQQHAGWPGSRLLRSVIALAEPLTESPMETHLRLLLHDAGAPRPTAQYAVRDDRRRLIGRVDFAYPQWRIAIEYEGDHHRARAQFRRDVTRLNNLRSAGWLVLRFTADDVLRHPTRVVQQVADAIRERRH